MSQGPGEPGRGDRGWEWHKQEPTAPYPQPYDAPTQGHPPPAGSYSPPAYGPPPPGYGAPPMGYGYGYAPPPNDGLGVAALIAGIVSLVLCFTCIGLLAAPAALFMGRASMTRIDRSNGALGGRGQAKAGFVLGIIGTVLLVLAVAAVVVAVAIGSVHSGGTTVHTGSGNV